MKLTGSVCIVTGAGSGIGRGIAVKFAQEGAAIALLDVNAAAASQTQALLPAEASASRVYPCDVTEDGQVQRIVHDIADQLGPPTILINSAGIEIMASIDEMTEQAWDRQLDVNVKSMFLCCKHVLPWMRQAGGGSIVNISSVLGILAAPHHVAYCASKGAVLQFTKALGYDVASDGVRVNCILPGPIDTPMYRQTIAAYGDAEAAHAAQERAVPLGRIGSAADVANAAAFLCSAEASFITCTSLLVDGGFSASNIH